MRTVYTLLFSTALFLTASCTTLDKSMRLGVLVMGSIGGATATHAAHSSAGTNPTSQDVVSSTAIGH